MNNLNLQLGITFALNLLKWNQHKILIANHIT